MDLLRTPGRGGPPAGRSKILTARRALRRLAGALTGIAALAAAHAASAEEVIHDFDVTIEVETTGDVVVTENITVTAEGREIKRGIYRDLPFSSGGGSRLEVMSVTRGGRAEPYHMESGGEGVLLYIGRRDVFLEPGVYSYQIVYRVEDEVRFFSDYDEIYWNVTGDDWAFAIERASAYVILPPGAEILSTAAYTGGFGDTGDEFEVRLQSEREVRFFTTAPLPPGEGFTVAVAFPRDIVEGPTDAERLLGRIGGWGTLVGLAGLALLLGYYWLAWSRVGKDPKARALIPHYQTKLPPAAVRFIDRMGFDQQTFVAAILSLAVKGHIKIDEAGGDYTISRRPAEETATLAPPSPGEAKLRDRLLPFASDAVTIDRENRSAIKRAESALKTLLESRYNTEFFKRNRGYIFVGVGLTIAMWIAMVLIAGGNEIALFLSVWLTGWSVGVVFIGYRVVMAWRDFSRNIANAIGAVFLTCFSVPFVVAWFVGAGFLSNVMPWQSIALGVLAAATNALFFDWMKVRTPLGREFMDEIEGLRLYLSVAEKDRLNFHNPPDRTPEHFEEMLPYALALGVENEWAENFSDVFERLAAEGRTYRPRWYGGHHFRLSRLSSLGKDLTSSVASATAAKSSSGRSSGSFGGGFSGGGGGGGGGGGW